MAEKGFKRKLTAILSADVEGYSRLMGEDEEATVRTLTAYREVLTTLIQQHNGRVLDSPGDNLLAEFASVVDTVQCAVAVQKEINALNEELPENRRMQFRIGINLGDVIQEEERIYGDGVNIAARLEGLSEPGGICISKTAFDHIESKLPYGYEFLGDQTVKNIAKPVGAYRVLMRPDAAGKVIGEKRFLGRYSRRTAMAAIIILVMVAVGLVSWNIYLHQSKRIEPASVEKMAYPLPDKPSIAVLPFANMSDDPKQEYFSDGIAEDLITDLSKISGLFVIARNSTFAYKGRPVKIRQVAEELGVRYVLEGSVRKADEKVRITAQLIDVTTGGHLWANRYDGQLSDVFALQDKITQKIVSALAVKLTTIEKGHVGGRDTHNIEAYDVFLRGLDHIRRYNPDDFAQAIFFFKKAVELDPSYWRAYAMLAWTYWESLHNIWVTSLGISDQEAHLWAEEYLQKAMNKPNAIVHQVASKMYADRYEHDEAIAQAQRSISLDPNDENSYLAMAYVLIRAGRPEDALDFVKKAMRIDPHYPPYYLYVLGLAHFGMEDFEEAATSFQRAVRRNPEFLLPLLYLVAAYAYLGRQQEAGTAIEELNKIIPGFTLGWVGGSNVVERDLLLNGLRKAGVPESPWDLWRRGEQK